MKRERDSSELPRAIEPQEERSQAAASRRRRRRRWLVFRLVYLLIVIIGAIALWLLIPEDVKTAVRETYLDRP